MVCAWQQKFAGLKDAVSELGIKGLLGVCGAAAPVCLQSLCMRV